MRVPRMRFNNNENAQAWLEIGEILSVSTGRVSQIKSAAIKKLKSLIESEVNA